MKPEPGSEWFSVEMQETYVITGWTDEYGGMAIGHQKDRKSVIYFRPEDFGTRLRQVKETPGA